MRASRFRRHLQVIGSDPTKWMKKSIKIISKEIKIDKRTKINRKLENQRETAKEIQQKKTLTLNV